MNLSRSQPALGVVQAIFQPGWLGGLIGVQAGPITAGRSFGVLTGGGKSVTADRSS
jgi:hypothetical protein